MKTGESQILIFILLITMVGISCDRLLLPKDPSSTQVNNFDNLWKEYDAHYSYFIYKKVNWDSLYSVYRPQVSNDISNDSLFNVMSRMLSRLQDGHVSLRSPFKLYTYSDWYNDYTDHFDLEDIRNNYLKDGYTITPSRKMLYGQLTSQIGYIYIISFSGDNWPSELNAVLTNLQDSRGLIIDVRDNFGGNDHTMLDAAGHFADQKRLFRLIRYRNGPAHDDFTNPINGYIEPDGKVDFTGDIAVLTNRGVFSAAESFVMALRTMPYVVTIGDTTGGGSANPIDRELPNGWTYTISTWIESTPDGIIHEGKGIPPDIAVMHRKTDLDSETDSTLETAINYLKNRQTLSAHNITN